MYLEDSETNDNDMEEILDQQEMMEKRKPSKKAIKAVRNLADIYASQEQLGDKGNLLGHYKSIGFLKTFIDIYERAAIGKAESGKTRKSENFQWGYARLSRAVVENRILYLVMNDESIYRLRHIKEAEKVAYMINEQIFKTRNGL